MGQIGYVFTILAGFLTVFLLGWREFDGSSMDWVFGLIAVGWSFIMMGRVAALTTQKEFVTSHSGLAQKIIKTLWQKRDENHQILLETSFGGSFVLFTGALFIFAAWQIYCAAFPAQSPALESLRMAVDSLAGPARWGQIGLFSWGQIFMLLLALPMIAFVLRSYAADLSLSRRWMLVFAFYAAGGFLFFSSLDVHGQGGLTRADLTGNGSGSWAFLLGSVHSAKPSLFDILLIESGVTGLAIVSFAVFVPLGCIAMAASKRGSDFTVSACGIVTGLCLILSVFLTYTPALGAYMVLCWMGLFLAWGASEYAFEQQPLTKEQI